MKHWGVSMYKSISDLIFTIKRQKKNINFTNKIVLIGFNFIILCFAQVKNHHFYFSVILDKNEEETEGSEGNSFWSVQTE